MAVRMFARILFCKLIVMTNSLNDYLEKLIWKGFDGPLTAVIFSKIVTDEEL